MQDASLHRNNDPFVEFFFACLQEHKKMTHGLQPSLESAGEPIKKKTATRAAKNQITHT